MCWVGSLGRGCFPRVDHLGGGAYHVLGGITWAGVLTTCWVGSNKNMMSSCRGTPRLEGQMIRLVGAGLRDFLFGPSASSPWGSSLGLATVGVLAPALPRDCLPAFGWAFAFCAGAGPQGVSFLGRRIVVFFVLQRSKHRTTCVSLCLCLFFDRCLFLCGIKGKPTQRFGALGPFWAPPSPAPFRGFAQDSPRYSVPNWMRPDLAVKPQARVRFWAVQWEGGSMCVFLPFVFSSGKKRETR